MSVNNSIVISSFPEDEEENSLSWFLGKIFCRPSWSETTHYGKTSTFITNSDSGYFDWTDSSTITPSQSYQSNINANRWSDYELSYNNKSGNSNDEFNNKNFMKDKPFDYTSSNKVITKSSSLLSSIYDYITTSFNQDTEEDFEIKNWYQKENSSKKTLSSYSLDDNNNNNSITGILNKDYNCEGMSSIRKASETQISPVAEQHYRRLLSQISLSNCSLVRENEAMKERLQELESLLDDHMKHLKSIYFTLHKKGYSKLEFPDGDEVNLSQFEGLLLNFKKSPLFESCSNTSSTDDTSIITNDKHFMVEGSSSSSINGESFSNSSRKSTTSFTELPPVQESFSE